MDDLLLHPLVQAQLERLVKSPLHAICLTGADGAGKSYLAQTLAQTILAPPTSQAVKTIAPVQKSIGIDAIRELQQFLKLKMPGRNQVRRVVIIENSEQMTVEAQNALLKTLEEPVDDAMIILTCANLQYLLPTIKSRVFTLRITPPTLESTRQYFKKFSKAEVKRAYLMANGSAGLIHALLNHAAHPLIEAIEAGKQIIAQPAYERLVQADEWTKDKEKFKNLLFGLKRILSTSLEASSSSPQKTLQALRSVYQAEKTIDGSPNLKLLVTNLFLQL